MGFYLRKSFRMGPLRLNLSKSGFGISAGVPGMRFGVSATGRPYVHAGRGGLYYREYLGSGRRRPSASPARPGADEFSYLGPAVLYEDTGVTYPPEDPAEVGATPMTLPGDRALDGASVAGPGIAILLGAGVLALAALLTAGVARIVALAIAGVLVVVWAVLDRRSRGRAQARATLHGLLQAACADAAPLAAASLTRLHVATRDPRLDEGAARAELRGAYLEAAVRLAADGYVEEGEATLLEQLEESFAIDPESCAAARLDAYHALYLAAVADRELSAQEEASLDGVRKALRVPPEDVAPEQAVLQRLHGLREIRAGRLPVVDPGVPLESGERCHYAAPARLLREKTVRRFQRDGRKYKVRGLTVVAEGTLLLTDRRVLVIAEGTTSVPADRILDLDVDLDRNLLRLTEDERVTPILITTPDAATAGAVIAAVAKL